MLTTGMPGTDTREIHCACGYDRQGLANDAVCPECGLLDIQPRPLPKSPMQKARRLALQMATLNFFPVRPDQSPESVAATVGSRVAATVGFWTCVAVVLQAWWVEESRSDLPDMFILPVVGCILLSMVVSLIAVVLVFGSLFGDRITRVLRNGLQAALAGVLPPVLFIMLLSAIPGR